MGTRTHKRNIRVIHFHPCTGQNRSHSTKSWSPYRGIWYQKGREWNMHKISKTQIEHLPETDMTMCRMTGLLHQKNLWMHL